MSNEEIKKAAKKENVLKVLPEDYQFNLSDFALFLSVMKVKEAYENVLSIILDESDLKLKEVKAEQVVLNKSGKRSRFYQGMIDTPILKSGKETRYKHLPSTTIIFITQEDIFGKDLAMYTFSERCEEEPELSLEDGTRKIFLNMTSKNGRAELISLLQYMRHTTLDNKDITVKDKRILNLDRIVEEVKQSEEWEAVKMNLLEIGIEKGIEQGIEQGIKQGIEQSRTKIIRNMLSSGLSNEEVSEVTQIPLDVVREVERKANVSKEL